MTITLGSLFDGIGAFPLSASRYGIIPVWASEIDKQAISVTRRHFPDMLHLGSVTDIDGAKIPPADIITFGSPCQDLSIAGKGAGLDGERSGLFREAVRIIREMREATNGEYPTVAIWENVPGAYSSHKGEDFRTVLEELARIAEPGVSIPRPPKREWNPAGCIVGDGWSIAWRTPSAQFWGVPQRRSRIYLVTDFAGQRAGEVSFESESLRGYPPPGGEAGKEAAAHAGDSTSAAGFDLQQITSPGNRSSISFDSHFPSLCACGRPHVITSACSVQQNQCGECRLTQNISGTLNTNGNATGRNAPLLIVWPDINGTLLSRHDSSPQAGQINNICCVATGQPNAEIMENLCPTLNCNHEQPYIAGEGIIVRRLTPVECERLQGFPDDWTAWGVDEKGRRVELKDSPRYRMIGNSNAIPNVMYLMAGLENVLRVRTEEEKVART